MTMDYNTFVNSDEFKEYVGDIDAWLGLPESKRAEVAATASNILGTPIIDEDEIEEKSWQYVDNPSEAPEDAEVEEAPQTEGRYRYQTESESSPLVDDIMDDVQDVLDDRNSEDEQQEETEDEESDFDASEHYQSVMSELPVVPDEPDGMGSQVDVSVSDAGGGASDERTAEAVSNLLDNGEILDVPVDAESGVDDYENFEPETQIPLYDSESNSGYGYVDLEIDPEDYANIQQRIHEEFADVSREQHFGSADPDDVRDIAEQFLDGDSEIPIPYMVVNEDGEMTSTQEGRHRALGAMAAGLDDIPVRVIVDYSEKSVKQQMEYPEQEEEEQQESDNADWQPYLGPEGGTGWQNMENGEIDYSDEHPQTGELHPEIDEDEYEDSSGGADEEQPDVVDADEVDLENDYRTIDMMSAQENDMLEEGTNLAIYDDDNEADVILQIENVEGNPLSGFTNAGYMELSDGTYMTFMGGIDSIEDPPEDMTEENTRATTDASVLDKPDPEPSGSENVNEWNIDWTDYDKESADNGNFRRLNDQQKRVFRDEWRSVADEDAVQSVENDIRRIKGSTMNSSGEKLDMLAKQVHGIEGQPRQPTDEYEWDEPDDPTNEELLAYEYFSKASQKFFKENFGETAEVYRGMGTHAEASITEAIEDYFLNENEDETFSMGDNPNSVWTTDEGMASSFGTFLESSIEIDSDEVLSMPEALLEFDEGPGPDWNEGEVNISGDAREVTPENFTIKSTDTTIDEVLDAPMEVWHENEKGSKAVVTFARMLNEYASDEMQHEFEEKFKDHRAFDSGNEDMQRVLNALDYNLDNIFEFQDEGVSEVDVDLSEGNPDWLDEAAQDRDVEEIRNDDDDDNNDDDNDGTWDVEIVEKPFAGYDTFEDCVDDNSDKEDPEAYCAQIHYDATGEYPGKSEPDLVQNVGVDKGLCAYDISMERMREMDVDDYDELDRYIFEAIESQVWPDNLVKDEMWTGDDDVPDWVSQWVGAVVERMNPLYGDYDDIPSSGALEIQKEIKESLTQPQGWSTASITEKILNDFDWLERRQAERIVRQEVAAVLNKSREVALRARPDQQKVDWVGPDDANTTRLCSSVKDEIESRGGNVEIEELKNILREKARDYREESGGTPERVDEYVPHFQCRHTLERVDVE